MATQVNPATAGTYPKILNAGTQANYDAITTKDANKLYFCTDTGKLYKGDVDFTNAVRIVTSFPEAPLKGLVYVNSATGEAKAYDGTAWHVIGPVIDKSGKDAEENDISTISATSTDDAVPSSKNVYLYVQEEMSDLVADVVTNVTAKANTSTGTPNNRATIVKTTGSGESLATADVVVPGVVTNVTYTQANREIVFHSSTEEDFTITLGKDIFVDKEADNRYDPADQSIHIYLNDGTDDDDPTELVIPVADLIATYEVADTASVDMTLTTKSKEVDGKNISYQEFKADVKLRPDVEETGSEFTNALKLSETTGAEGLYVDLADEDADIKTLDEKIGFLAASTTEWGTF